MAVVERSNKSGTVYWVVNAWNGKQAWERVGTKRREAEVRDRQMKAEIKAGLYQPKSGSKAVTLGSFAETWGNGRTNANGREERRQLRLYLEPRSWLTEKRLSDVTHNDIDRLVVELKAERKYGSAERRLSDKTISNFIDTLMQLFKGAIRLGHCTTQPVMLERKTLRREPTREREIYSPAEVAVLVRHHAIPTPIRVLNALCVLAGLRKGEACGRRWSDIDGDAPILPGLMVRSQYEGRELKTRRPRVVPIHPELSAILDAWHRDGFELYTGRKPTRDDFIVPQAGRRSSLEHWGPATYYKAFVASAGAAGIRARTLHSTRHTFISLCRRGGARRDVLEKVTHNARGGVIDWYTHFDWAPLCEAVLCLRLDAHQAEHRPSVLSGETRRPGLARGVGNADNSARTQEAEQGLVPGYERTAPQLKGSVAGPSKFSSQGTGAPPSVVELTREERLSVLAQVDPDGARPGLAVCRALTAAYRVGAGEPGAEAELDAALSDPDALVAVGGGS